MTDKQSTVVVSRELLEAYLGIRKGSLVDSGNQLRALLAATPEQAVDVGEPAAIGILYRAYDETIVFESAGEIHVTDGMEVFAQPPAKPRITMADTMRAYQSAARTPHLVGTSNWCAHMAEQLNQCSGVATVCGGAPNISALPPAKIVLPERRESDHYHQRAGKCATADLLAEEWNACLDATTSLNTPQA